MTITKTAGRVDQRTRVATETVPVDHDSAGMNGLTLRRGWYLPVKSILERLAAAILLILAVPIMFAMGVLIKLTSRGPVFYVQTRVGKHGRQFQMIKLRTMVRDAEKQTGPVWATQGDPRITPLGRLLRDTHLDELPQLLNVVAGHMSLIGPRPERPSFVADVFLDMPEMGVEGLAEVLAIEPCPPLEDGEGRLVTGTFKHTSGEVYDLKLESESKPIGVTATHPFWSVDREAWVSAIDLEIGETLKTLAGTTVVESRSKRAEPEAVYNIEVEGDHCYRVGESGVLVHNASAVWTGPTHQSSPAVAHCPQLEKSGETVMPRLARGEVIAPQEVQVIHAVQRCVRRAFLCGEDPLTGQSFEHRRAWIRQRIEFLASVFGIDCLTYAVMHNHLHVVLRSRPDVVAMWSDEDVARRWLRLFPPRREDDGSPAEPTDAELLMITGNADVLAERRTRLSDVSWWMRCTAEVIARRANKEDRCTARFWEGRYKAQIILDEAGLMACAAYVDLNPIRAALTKTPEKSDYTGVKDRLDDLAERENRASRDTHDWERSRRRLCSGWMSPVEIDARHADAGPDICPSGRRASRKGFLSCSLADYLSLLDWTGRQLRGDKRGAIPAHLAPILQRIGLDGHGWCDLVKKFGRTFKRAAGSTDALQTEAERRGQGWLQAPGNPLSV
eukprot:g5293.t1